MDAAYRKSIVSYYDQTRMDYRWLWLNKKNRSVHFGYYDQSVKSHADALLNLNKELARRAGIKDGDLILDAGCGQGGSSLWLAETYDVKVSGITLVPHQVHIANSEAKKRKLQNSLTFYEQDYCATDFPDETFTVVWACESMCHAVNKEDFYREAMRLLKPGGRLICADYIRTKRPHPDDGELLLRQWLNGWSIQDLDSYEEHIMHANAVGFVNVKIDNTTEYTRPSLQHLYSMSTKLWSLGKFLRKLGLRNDVKHGNQFGSIKQYEALQNDLWYYGIISATKAGI